MYVTKWKSAVSHPSTLKKKSRMMARDLMLRSTSLISNKREECSLRLLYCHYVFDDQIGAFENIIKNLTELGVFVSTKECLDLLEGRSEINKRYFHLSFDDGFKNIYKNAVPILSDYQVPALFFVPSDYVSGEYPLTREYCNTKLNMPSVVEMITWEELKHMRNLGFDIGSHTKSHARLSDISSNDQQLNQEVIDSKHFIEDKIGDECRYFSWPYGTACDVDSKSMDTIMNAGYKACFSAVRGKIVENKTDIFNIPRHHFEAQWPMSHIRYFAMGGGE